MSRKTSTLDGTAMVFFLAGVFLFIFSSGQNVSNLGWVLMVIGIVKQLMEWR